MSPKISDFVFDPESWFGRRADRLNGGFAVVIALFVALILTVQIGGFMWVVTEQMTGTITRDNPDRPPEWMCENDSESPWAGMNTTPMIEGDDTPAGCTEPKQETVEIGTLVWQKASGILVQLFFGMLLLWFLGGAVIHLLVGGIESEGTLGQTLEVLAWAGIVQVVTLTVALIPLFVSVQGAPLSASDIDAVLTAIRSIGTGGLAHVATVVGAGGAIWQSYVLFGGLIAVHDVDRGRVALVAGFVAIVLVLSVVT